MRIILFSILTLAVFYSPLPAIVPAALLYTLWFPGYELLIMGAAVDALFGDFSNMGTYSYTLTMAITLICVETVRPYLNIRFLDV